MSVVATEVVQTISKELLDNITKALALFGGTDGLLPIRRLIRRIARAGLGPGLDVGLEVGAGQSAAVLAALRAALPRHRFRVGRDFGGHDRMVLAECRLEPA